MSLLLSSCLALQGLHFGGILSWGHRVWTLQAQPQEFQAPSSREEAWKPRKPKLRCGTQGHQAPSPTVGSLEALQSPTPVQPWSCRPWKPGVSSSLPGKLAGNQGGFVPNCHLWFDEC